MTGVSGVILIEPLKNERRFAEADTLLFPRQVLSTSVWNAQTKPCSGPKMRHAAPARKKLCRRGNSDIGMKLQWKHRCHC